MTAAEKSKMTENGRRIAKNASMLYLRMLVLTLVGLFTSRIVLRELGVDDYGIWTAVGGVVTIFTFVTNSIATAISRFLAYELGRADSAKLRRVFASSLTVQLLLCLVLILLVEGVGMWFLNEKMVLPLERMQAARFVLHCSLAVLLLNMLSVPYNAAIVAHERLSVFAWISIVEGVLKLTITLLLSLSLFDKLQTYALLMVGVAVIIRMAYGLYCRRNFEETRTRPVYDRPVLRELLGFASWSFIGGSTYVLNTQGSNLLVNLFFGVALNAAKGLSVQVETVFKQLASNLLNALNPQITKSWASGDREYCFSIVAKGIKFICLAMLLLLVPIELEAELLLNTWLKEVPPGTVLFVRLGMIAVLIDMAAAPLLTLILAIGKIKNYYKLVSFNYLFFLLLIYLAFRLGGAVHWVYICLIVLYTLIFAIRLVFVKKDAAFPLWKLFRKVILPLTFLGVFAFALALVPRTLLPEGFVRLLLVCILAWLTIFVGSFIFIMTPGERAVILKKLGKWIPDRLYLEVLYYDTFGRRLNLKNPTRYTEKVQWLKLYDRNPLYSTFVDKAEVKHHVEKLIGKEYIVPNLGVWNSTQEIDWDALPSRFALKCTHDSGSYVICHDKATLDKEAVCKKLEAALQVNHYERFREWVYKTIPPRIIAESYLDACPNDYKFFCCNGEPILMYVVTDRLDEKEGTKADYFDIRGDKWEHLDIIRAGRANATIEPQKPLHYEKMKELASALTQGIPHVRIDFYEIDGKIYFGEYTFYHDAGFVPFEPDSADELVGSMFKLPKKR